MSHTWSTANVNRALTFGELKESIARINPFFFSDAVFDQFSADGAECPDLCCQGCKGVGFVENAFSVHAPCLPCDGTGWAGGVFPFSLVGDDGHGPQEIR